MIVLQGLKPVLGVGKTRRAACHRLILLGLLAPLLFTSAAAGQSAWPPPIPKFFLPASSDPDATPACRARPQDLTKPPPDLQPAAGPPAPTPVVVQPASSFHQQFHFKPAATGLPPASAFALQTDLRKYLDTWPTPGATTTDDWPEYVGESDQELD
jgi:hypothetical protein